MDTLLARARGTTITLSAFFAAVLPAGMDLTDQVSTAVGCAHNLIDTADCIARLRYAVHNTHCMLERCPHCFDGQFIAGALWQDLPVILQNAAGQQVSQLATEKHMVISKECIPSGAPFFLPGVTVVAVWAKRCSRAVIWPFSSSGNGGCTRLQMLSLFAGSLDQKKGRNLTLGCNTCRTGAALGGGAGGPLPPDRHEASLS